MKEIANLLKTVVTYLDNPTFIVLFLVIAALVFLLWHKDKCLDRMSVRHNTELLNLSDKIVSQINALSISMEKQITLFEVLIYREKR